MFVLQQDDVVEIAIDKINALLESFLGINDAELGMSKDCSMILRQSMTIDNFILQVII